MSDPSTKWSQETTSEKNTELELMLTSYNSNNLLESDRRALQITLAKLT